MDWSEDLYAQFQAISQNWISSMVACLKISHTSCHLVAEVDIWCNASFSNKTIWPKLVRSSLNDHHKLQLTLVLCYWGLEIFFRIVHYPLPVGVSFCIWIVRLMLMKHKDMMTLQLLPRFVFGSSYNFRPISPYPREHGAMAACRSIASPVAPEGWLTCNNMSWWDGYCGS
jgi:hypothetical protein